MGGSRRDGVTKGVGAGVELGPAEDVEVVAESDRDEIGEAVAVVVTGHPGERGPCGGGRVEEAGRRDGGVSGKEGEEVVAGEAEPAAEREENERGEEGAPRPGDDAESGLVRVG